MPLRNGAAVEPLSFSKGSFMVQAGAHRRPSCGARNQCPAPSVPCLEETVFTQHRPSASRSTSIAFSVVLIAAFVPDVIPVAVSAPAFKTPVRSFERVATFDVPGQVAEIVAATPDGETLIYTDSAAEQIGFVTITEPGHPTSGGSLAMPGEPISVAVTPDGAWALVVVHGASEDALVVVDLGDRTINTSMFRWRGSPQPQQGARLQPSLKLSSATC
jgi:hypothetical protein